MDLFSGRPFCSLGDPFSYSCRSTAMTPSFEGCIFCWPDNHGHDPDTVHVTMMPNSKTYPTPFKSK